METLVLVVVVDKPVVDKVQILAADKTLVEDKTSAANKTLGVVKAKAKTLAVVKAKAKTSLNPPHNTHLSTYIKTNSVFHHQRILNYRPSR